MPIYEYECRRCGRRIEAMQRLSDPPLSECEQCGGELRKLISAPAFQFKGSGWYVTDYAKSGSGNGKSADDGKPSEAKGGKDPGGKEGGGKEQGGGAKESAAAPAPASGGGSGSTPAKSKE